jgi:hypothetical protein
MILVMVCYQNGINPVDIFAQHLVPEIWPGIYHNSFSIILQHYR